MLKASNEFVLFLFWLRFLEHGYPVTERIVNEKFFSTEHELVINAGNYTQKSIGYLYSQ